MRVRDGRIGSGMGGRRVGGALVRAAVLMSLVTAVASAAWAEDKDKDDDDFNDTSWSARMESSVKDGMASMGSKIGLGKPAAPPAVEAANGCPTITILPGTEVQRVMAPGGTGNQNLKYQYSLYTIGRECAVTGDRVAIKVGAAGRVLLGPAGAAGHFDVPIRVAVFSDAQHRAVESRLFKVPVALGAGQAAAPFDFVSQGLTVAIPPGHAAEYRIMVGIDGGKGGNEAGSAKVGAKHARNRKPDAAQSASSD